MQNVSADYQRIQLAHDKSYEAKLVIDGVGEFGHDEIVDMSTSIALFDGQPNVGTAVAAEINVSLLPPSAEIPRMACLRPYIRVSGSAPASSAVTIHNGVLTSQYATYSNGKITFAPESGAVVSGETLIFPVDGVEYLTSEWIPQGVFYIDTRETTANYDGIPVLTIHGYDAMLKTEQMYASNDTVGDAPDTQYVQAIADAIGVDVDPRTWDIMRGYAMPFPLGYTMREILGYIAASYVGSFIMSDEGKLRLVSLLDLPDAPTESLLADDAGYVIIFGTDAIIV